MKVDQQFEHRLRFQLCTGMKLAFIKCRIELNMVFLKFFSVWLKSRQVRQLINFMKWMWSLSKCNDFHISNSWRKPEVQNFHRTLTFKKSPSYASAYSMITNILRASFCAKRVTQNNNLYGFEVLFHSLPEVFGCLKRFMRICQRGILLSFVFSCNALYR